MRTPRLERLTDEDITEAVAQAIGQAIPIGALTCRAEADDEDAAAVLLTVTDPQTGNCHRYRLVVRRDFD
jgi:hypothetical protein